jgi:protein-tyrosine phosphatase
MAEGLLSRRLTDAGLDAAVSSAGLYPGGVAATAHAATTLDRRGIDLSAHRSRQLSPELVQAADLVVGMTREHVREVVVLQPDALSRSFTLKELVRAGEVIGPRRRGEELRNWLARAAEGRRAADLLDAAPDPELDVADPIGGPLKGYERTAAELDDLLGRLVRLLWPAATEQERSA